MANKYLVLGRAGSGKTRFVLNKFLEFVKEHREKHVLFLLPTRSQVEHLKDLILKNGDVEGFLDVSFFTFSSLALNFFEKNLGHQGTSIFPERARLISDGGKDLLLKSILYKHRVKCFEEVYDSPGFRQVVLKFFKELKENSLYPKQFEDIVDNISHPPSSLSPPGEAGDGKATHAEKYAGLASTYARLQQVLENNGLFDPEDLSNVFLNNLEDDDALLAGREILLVDGFHDFTPIEFKILSLLIQRKPEVYVTLSLDPDLRERQALVFQTAAQTYSRLTSLGLKEVALRDSYRTHNPVFVNIERNLFRKHGEVVEAAGDSLCVIEATGIRDEVDQMARRIYDMVMGGGGEQGEGIRYKDIGIIFRDVGKYCDLVEDIFPGYGIPVRIYTHRPLRENYAVKALLNVLNVFRENWADKWVIKTLKSDYLGLDKDMVDAFEHAALNAGIIDSRKHWVKLARPPQFKQIKRFLNKLASLEKDIQTNQTPTFFKDWFLTLIDDLIIVKRPPAGETRPVPGEVNVIRRDVAAIETLVGLIDDVVLACETEGVRVETQYTLFKTEDTLYFREFVEMLLPLLDVATYSVRDKRDDVVNVIDTMEARQWELPIVFVGGLLEREFPKQVRENLFLKDRVRREINAQHGVRLKEELRGGDEERHLFYIAVTRARERLFLSYPATNDTGNKNLPSFFLLEVKKLFTSDSYARILHHRGLSQAVHNVDDILTSRDLKNYVFYQLNAPYRKGSAEEKAQGLTLWLYNQLRMDGQFMEEMRIALENRCDAFIDSDPLIRKLKEANVCYSATRLNDYAQCPFLHFYKHILKIEKPPSLAEDGLDNLMQGNIIHMTLEEYVRAKFPPPFFP